MLNFILVVISSLLAWFNIQTMWNWFLVPLGLVPITYLQAGAVLLMIKYIQHFDDSTEEIKLRSSSDNFTEEIIYKITFGLVGLLLAWFLHLGMS